MPVASSKPGLHGHDLAAHDDRGIHLAKGHAQQIEDADARPGRDALDRRAEIAGEDRQENQADNEHREHHDPNNVADSAWPILFVEPLPEAASRVAAAICVRSKAAEGRRPGAQTVKAAQAATEAARRKPLSGQGIVEGVQADRFDRLVELGRVILGVWPLVGRPTTTRVPRTSTTFTHCRPRSPSLRSGRRPSVFDVDGAAGEHQRLGLADLAHQDFKLRRLSLSGSTSSPLGSGSKMHAHGSLGPPVQRQDQSGRHGEHGQAQEADA